jgi:hypothetical protein
MEGLETSGWRFRHEPGRFLSVESAQGALVLVFVGSLFGTVILSLFFMAFLQLFLPLGIAQGLSALIMVPAWFALVVFKKRNVVEFDPPLLVEHRRRPWGWRRKALSFPLDAVEVVAETDISLLGVVTCRLSLRSGDEQRELCLEQPPHRRFIRQMGARLASELGCPFVEKLDHEHIRVVESTAPRDPSPDTLVFDAGGQKVFGYLLTAFGAFAVFLLWTQAAPDAYRTEGPLAGLLVGLVVPLIPGLFIYFGVKVIRGAKEGLMIDVGERRAYRTIQGQLDPRYAPLKLDEPDVFLTLKRTNHAGDDGPARPDTYTLWLCTGPSSIQLHWPKEMKGYAEEVFPWTREMANQLELPVELVREKMQKLWDRMEAGEDLSSG